MFINSNNNKHYQKRRWTEGWLQRRDKEIKQNKRNGTRWTNYLHNQQIYKSYK